jgi:DNA replication protein DnaC
LIVTGTTGSGKTHLMQGAAASVIERGESPVFVIWADFVFGLRQKIDASHEYMGKLRDADYLVIDEVLSARDSTSFLAETLQDLLGHRTHYNKPTMLAGNLVAEGDTPAVRKQWWIDRVGERFVSRMTDKTVVKVVDMWECEDLRPQQQTPILEAGRVR